MPVLAGLAIVRGAPDLNGAMALIDYFATWGRDSVNREHLYPDAALRPDRVLDERVLVERQRH